MASAIEDAGFEVRDMIEWVYGSGFPKSLNIGKAVDKLQGNEREVVGTRITGSAMASRSLGRGNSDAGSGQNEIEETKGTSEWEGWGTATKPAHEPICMARKPLAEKTVAENCLKYGTGGINIDESRVEGKINPKDYGRGGGFVFRGDSEDAPKPNTLGRFPANLIHDNSEEVRECFPDVKTGGSGNQYKRNLEYEASSYQMGGKGNNDIAPFSGNASRFFKSIIYQAKASKSERNKGCEELEEKPKVFNGQSDKPSTEMKDVEKRFTTLPKANNHPTVKPIALMEYLIKMVTREGQTVLDPFSGSGTT